MNPLAVQFDAIIRLWLTPSQYRKLCAGTDTESPVCLSHDWCDANQAMLDAFEIVHGRDPFDSDDGLSEADACAMADARQQAKQHWYANWNTGA